MMFMPEYYNEIDREELKRTFFQANNEFCDTVDHLKEVLRDYIQKNCLAYDNTWGEIFECAIAEILVEDF